MIHCRCAILDEREPLRCVQLHQLRDAVEAPGPMDGGQLPGSLTNQVSHGQVHPELAIESDTSSLKESPCRWAWDTM